MYVLKKIYVIHPRSERQALCAENAHSNNDSNKETGIVILNTITAFFSKL